MNPILKTRQAPASFLELLYAPIEAEMRRVESRLAAELSHDHPFVDELTRYTNRLGGKRLRPALLLLTAKAVGDANEDHELLAAIVEMIHTATLVHDDVLDEADTRRHLATVNSRWTNETSVLLGDFLFSHAFYLASTLGDTLACQIIGKATNAVCAGEMRQVASRGDFGLSEDEYFAIIGGKTAALCACASELGARFAGADDEQVALLSQMGGDLGCAFQIVDDLLDLTGEADAVGKSLGCDLQMSKPTLPIIHALSNIKGADRQELLELLSSGQATSVTVRPWLDRFDSLGYARNKAEWYAKRAGSVVRQLPPGPATDALSTITEFVTRRKG